ncbi:Intersectin-1 [Taenia crassiceps]|uniref:tRNA (guanine(37)-N1)-methyltransferase n=1 Tax=Taenia crassiceps TaxID=6207 RepID=A0ABR4QEX0_9CEST
MADEWNTWRITYEDRCKHDDRFQFLHPINGYITGEQARNFFTHSKLPNLLLAKIWELADLTADGQLDRREFSIAMFLIKKCLEGNSLPPQLPPSLLQEPQRFIQPILPDKLNPCTTLNSSSSTISNTIDSNEWSISAVLRPKYKLQFNQNDRNKRGYLTGVEARGIFLKSNLPQSQLAAIWNLADVDRDGNLTCEEFCIATYLIDQVLAGRKLPPTLPLTLMPSSLTQQGDRPKSTPIDSERKEESEGRMTFEDKRMQNFLLGQAELDKRKQDLAEQLRQEEEQRREQARFESEKQEKIRQERERERQRQAEAEVERARALEARRQEAATARLQSMREELYHRALETEKSRVEALIKERARQIHALEQARTHLASLEESAASQTTRREAVQSRVTAVQAEVEAQKAAILELATQRDAVERECRDLTEHMEAARAELHRWQREDEQLQRQLVPPPSVVVDITNTAEQQKTLRASLKQVQDSKRQLEQQLTQLETEVLRGGQTLASHRHSADELAKKRTLLATEVSALLATLLERRRTYRQQQHQHQCNKEQEAAAATATKQNDVDATNSIVSTALDAGPSETYTALYAYTATRPDELTFVERDKIRIFVSPPFEVCEGWLYGEMSGRRGLVPACYVKKASAGEAAPVTTADPFALPTTTSSATASINPFPAFAGPVHQPNSLPLADDTPTAFSGMKPLFTCLALYNFEAKLPGDLSLQIEDKVDVFVDNNGWYEGVSQRTGQRGLFPANHVQKLQSDTELSTAIGATTQISTTGVPTGDQSTAKVSPSPPLTAVFTDQEEREENGKVKTDSAVITMSKTPELAVVLTPFTAQSSEQLSLNVGQYVKIRKRSSKGWWEGETQQRGQDRQIGWFPADYVRLVNANNLSEAHSVTASTEPALEPTLVIRELSTDTAAVASSTGDAERQSPSSCAPVAATSAPIATSAAITTTSTDLASASMVQSMFAYKACQPDEMTFPEGALIEVLAHEEEGWWRGRIQSTGVEGLFPVNYVKPIQSDASAATSAPTTSSSTAVAISKPSAHQGSETTGRRTVVAAKDNRSTRQNIILEFIETERQYLRDLIEVKEKIYEGLKKLDVSERRLAKIFGNWTTLCDISEALNRDFQERKTQLKKGHNDAIGDILIRHLPKCMVYREFCTNQDLALESLQKLCDEKSDVGTFLRSCERFMRIQSMPLSSYFLKPMQRITKYKLLIEKLLKYTPANHPDYSNLQQSFELASTVLAACNEAIRNRESFAQLQWLRDHVTFEGENAFLGIRGEDDKRLGEMEIEVGGERRRRLLLLSGTFFKVKSGKELTAFLFTDMLLLTQPVNISASTLRSGNFTLPLKPDPTLVKANFKVYRRPISLAQINTSTSAPLSPKQRRRSIFRNTISRSSLADLSSVVSGGSGSGSGIGKAAKETRSKRLSLANLRQLSLSLNNLSGASTDAAESAEATTFVITDDGDPNVRILVRTPTEALKIMWLEEIRKAAAEYQHYLGLFRNPIRSNIGRASLFAAVVNLTVISASDLPMVGPNEDELPWPYCEASVCLRSKHTSVILSTRSPKWNSQLRFTVKDLTRDIITLYVYSKNTSSAAELLGKAEVQMPEVVEHCRGGETWKVVLPLTSTDCDAMGASITVSFSLTENGACLDEEDFANGDLQACCSFSPDQFTVYNLSNDVDVDKTKKFIEQYKKDNKDIIKRNRKKQSNCAEFYDRELEQERVLRERRAEVQAADEAADLQRRKRLHAGRTLQGFLCGAAAIPLPEEPQPKIDSHPNPPPSDYPIPSTVPPSAVLESKHRFLPPPSVSLFQRSVPLSAASRWSGAPLTPVSAMVGISQLLPPPPPSASSWATSVEHHSVVIPPPSTTRSGGQTDTVVLSRSHTAKSSSSLLSSAKATAGVTQSLEEWLEPYRPELCGPHPPSPSNGPRWGALELVYLEAVVKPTTREVNAAADAERGNSFRASDDGDEGDVNESAGMEGGEARRGLSHALPRGACELLTSEEVLSIHRLLLWNRNCFCHSFEKSFFLSLTSSASCFQFRKSLSTMAKDANYALPPALDLKLDRSAFRKVEILFAVGVPLGKEFKRTSEQLRNYSPGYLALPRFMNIYVDSSGVKRKLMLIRKIDDSREWDQLRNLNVDIPSTPNEDISYLESHPDALLVENCPLSERTDGYILPSKPCAFRLPLEYENYPLDRALKVVLPSDMEAVTGFTLVGHVAHFNLKPAALPYRKLIGQIALDKLPLVRTVVNKAAKIDAEFRTFAVDLMAGEENYLTEVKENGVTYHLDFSKVYWNSRLGTEHHRIIEEIKDIAKVTDATSVVVFDVFAGVGPFSIPLARTANCQVLANDLNPDSFYFLQENVRRNSSKKHPLTAKQIKCFNLDGRDFIRKIVLPFYEAALQSGSMEFFMLMNLPGLAIEFLDVFKGLKGEFPTQPIRIRCYCFVRHSLESDTSKTAKQAEADADVRQRVCEALGVRHDAISLEDQPENFSGTHLTGWKVRFVRNTAPLRDIQVGCEDFASSRARSRSCPQLVAARVATLLSPSLGLKGITREKVNITKSDKSV